MKRSELEGMTMWVCRECGEDSLCFRSGFGGTLPCLYPGYGFPKPAWREETIEGEPDLQEQIEELKRDVRSLLDWYDIHNDYHSRIDAGSEQLDDVTTETPPEKSLQSEQNDYNEGEGEQNDYPPIPDGYLVLPEPAGKPITETMRVIDSRGKAMPFIGEIVGQNVPELTASLYQIIDIAENVLPPLPDTHELVKWEEGMKWRSGDLPWDDKVRRWHRNKIGELNIDRKWLGEAIVQVHTNQGYFGRLKAVES